MNKLNLYSSLDIEENIINKFNEVFSSTTLVLDDGYFYRMPELDLIRCVEWRIRDGVKREI